MFYSRSVKDLAAGMAVAAVYFVAGKLGLTLAIVNPSATVVWPPAGIALAAFLVLGYRVWPAILLAAFLVNLTTAGNAATCLGIALGNTLEGVVGAFLVNRFARGREVFDRQENIIRFVILAGMGSTMVSATMGVTSLALGGLARWSRYGSIWSDWWLGDMAGVLVVAPALVLWSTRPMTRWRPPVSEATVLLLGLVLVGLSVFGGILPPAATDYPLFLCIPFLLWASFRFTQRQAATATLLLSSITIWGTLQGSGPFIRRSPHESLLLLQAFTGFMSVMTLAVAALVKQRRQVEEDLRRLAVSDSLTGLANHRQFVQVLEEELHRSQRTKRSFAVVLFDLDNLKAINDRHGHLVGSRALCRLADILQASCRSIDTAARFGGDEFGMLLVETEGASALGVAQRVCEQLAAEKESPSLSASAGVAAYPEDGESVETLLQAADHGLYQMKGGNRRGRPPQLPLQSALRQRK
ncbi:MAG: MASE1 domain-containing protein [Acidobacteriia bacterium]|nr:MASE1 domain-containing protein [Terriglobia bacterium]